MSAKRCIPAPSRATPPPSHSSPELPRGTNSLDLIVAGTYQTVTSSLHYRGAAGVPSGALSAGPARPAPLLRFRLLFPANLISRNRTGTFPFPRAGVRAGCGIYCPCEVILGRLTWRRPMCALPVLCKLCTPGVM